MTFSRLESECFNDAFLFCKPACRQACGYYNHCMILLERIHNLPVFVNGKLFDVAFEIFANVMNRNVMSVSKKLYVSMLRIVR